MVSTQGQHITSQHVWFAVVSAPLVLQLAAWLLFSVSRCCIVSAGCLHSCNTLIAAMEQHISPHTGDLQHCDGWNVTSIMKSTV